MIEQTARRGRRATAAGAGSRPPGYLDYAAANPMRGPDWRWRLAGLSLREELPDRPETRDPWVRRIREYLLALRGAGRAGGRGARRAIDPPVRAAALLHASPDPHPRGELEAWLLTGVPIAAIAARCGHGEGVVEAYAACFFDVRARLDAEGWILHVALGGQVARGFPYGDVAAIWKFVGYLRGEHCLSLVLHVFPGPRPRPWPATIAATGARRRRLVAACRKLVLTRWLRPGCGVAGAAARLASRLRAAAASTRGPEPAAPPRPVEIAVDLRDAMAGRDGSPAGRTDASPAGPTPPDAEGAVASA
ncbi:hypothetical protein OJF2_05780 [Aquisphaera giovannonii]|uniref:Uncharacterized protein n=1 Tax=Aquisphaera giovannonii TaxID=406548 RepID=A0A5B9VVD2_9BACT|nr:hypothetical protein [Aquisphaera giovannonii]QEH32109.1 hypothetical protein OJF2_05780 [Aquisphaera giovannonii]